MQYSKKHEILASFQWKGHMVQVIAEAVSSVANLSSDWGWPEREDSDKRKIIVFSNNDRKGNARRVRECNGCGLESVQKD
ncbi:unnamed protein product [Caretta caretta]